MEEERIKILEERVQWLRNIVWVVGVVAAVFGISGGWGIATLHNASQNIEKLNDQVSALEGNAATIEKMFSDIRGRQQEEFAQYVARKTNDFDSHVSQLTGKIQSNSGDIGDIRRTIAKIQTSYPSYGSRVRLRNEKYNRCMDLRAQDPSTLQLIQCKGSSVGEQSWTLDRR